MSLSLLLAFSAFAFVTSITPGPNNVMVLASGVNFGFRKTVPHIAGISLGFMVLVLAVGFGCGGLFEAYPVLYTILRYAGAAYLLYLAWGIARSGPMSTGETSGRPMSFLQAAAFQWINPKAWVMAVGAITAYVPHENFFINVIVIAAVFAVVNAPSVSSWAMFGVVLRRYLSDPKAVRVFNAVMALLLVASLYPLLDDLLQVIRG